MAAVDSPTLHGKPGPPRRRRRRITVFWLLGFLTLLLTLTWVLGWSHATQRVDRLLHDTWVRMTERAAPADIVIAAIDPESLQQLGRWPWPRELQAHLYRQLARNNVRAVVIDMLYTEQSSSPEDDANLALAIGELPISILPILTEGRSGPSAREKLPLTALTRQVNDLGHIFLPIDSDGIVRRVALKSGFNHAHWSALSLAAYAHIEPNVDAFMSNLPGQRIAPPELEFQWTQDYEVLIPFYGPKGTFPTVSAARIISGQVEPDELRNKIVFVGFTATGLVDVVPAPVSALDQAVPGVEIHANIYAGLRDGRMVEQLDVQANLLVALVLLPLMLWAFSRALPQWGLMCAVLGAFLPIALSYVLYRFFQLWYPPLTASIPVLISYLIWSWHRLDFVNRFLERENRMLEPHTTTRDSRDDQLLVGFFEHASRHLPIVGWQFSTRKSSYQGGEAIPDIPDRLVQERWSQRDGVFRKRYPTRERLQISLMFDGHGFAGELTRYIDTLARVRSRVQPTRFSGSIERLQANAMKLSDHMAWLRGVKVFSETTLAGSPAGFIVWNAAGEMVRSNDLLYRMLPGVETDALLRDFVAAIGRHPDTGLDRRALDALILRGESWQVTHVEGDAEHVIDFSAVGDTLSERLICASVIDVSEIRSAERARAEMVDYLSHDLRSPLISALYLLEEDDGTIMGEDRELRVEQNIRRSLEMMDDLLHVARADSLKPDTFDELLFNAVLDNALDQLMPQARSRQITMNVDTTDDDLWMDGDAASLERAVANIIGNAIKYSSDGGAIEVKAACVDGFAVLDVIDDGVGIDPEMMSQLFTRFKRDAKVSRQFKGIGLGLALVSRVVKQHGGEVFASSPGKGTRITMRLPIKRDDELMGDELDQSRDAEPPEESSAVA